MVGEDAPFRVVRQQSFPLNSEPYADGYFRRRNDALLHLGYRIGYADAAAEPANYWLEQHSKVGGWEVVHCELDSR